MVMFARISENGEWLPEESRMCLGYTLHLILCSRIVILQNRKLYGLLEKQKNEIIHHKLSFISQLAHDIGTPLASISFALQCLIADEVRPETSGVLKSMMTSVKMLLMIRNEAMHVSMLKVGLTPEPKVKLFDPKDLLEGCSQIISFFPGAEETIEFLFYIDHALPSQIEADFDWIWGMMINYLSNAKKYCKQGQIKVSLFTWKSMIWFEVEDEGDGVPDEKKKLLFKPFSQLESRRNGTGLGLYSVATKAKLIGGEYGVRNNCFHTGSVFWFNFPLKNPSPTALHSSLNHPNDNDSELLLLGKWDGHMVNRFQDCFDGFFQKIVVLKTVSDFVNINRLVKRKYRVLCWRERFSHDNIRSFLGVIDDSYGVTSMFLVHDSVEAFGRVDSVKNSLTDSFNKIAPTYELKFSLQDVDIIHAIRSRVWASSKVCIESSLDEEGSKSLTSAYASECKMENTSRIFEHHGKSPESKQKDILIIDDDTKQSSLITRLLEQQDYDICYTSNGAEGLELLQDPDFHNFGCCLVRLNVPMIGGIECIRRFRSWEKQQIRSGKTIQRTLLFALTHQSSEEVTNEALKAGADAIVPKYSDAKYIEALILKCTGNNCILLIDDSPSVTKFVGCLLAKEGFDVKIAKNGVEGLQILQSSHFLCVLCDLSMPEMDGIECIGRYREWERLQTSCGQIQRKQTIFAFTAHGDEDNKTLALEVGAQAILAKPFDMLQLKQLMAQHCFNPSSVLQSGARGIMYS